MATQEKQVEILIRLSAGGDEEYQRPYNDPQRGSVTNVGTYNRSYTAIRGGDRGGPHPNWFDLSPRQIAQCRAIAEEMGTNKIVVVRKKGSFRVSYVAYTYKSGAQGRYYVIECEIGQ